jgi:GNAT superfamily N-acetyltransferase
MKGRYTIRAGGQLRGMAMVTWVEDRWLLVWLYVVPEYRRHGYGTRLLEEIVGDADTDGVDIWLVPAPGPGGMSGMQLIKWYRQYGFQLVEGEPFDMVRRP